MGILIHDRPFEPPYTAGTRPWQINVNFYLKPKAIFALESGSRASRRCGAQEARVDRKMTDSRSSSEFISLGRKEEGLLMDSMQLRAYGCRYLASLGSDTASETSDQALDMLVHPDIDANNHLALKNSLCIYDNSRTVRARSAGEVFELVIHGLMDAEYY